MVLFTVLLTIALEFNVLTEVWMQFIKEVGLFNANILLMANLLVSVCNKLHFILKLR